MPPTSRGGAKKPKKPVVHSNPSKRTAKQKAALTKYNKQILSRAINSNRLLGTATLLPKELSLSVQYRQLITFTTSGHSTAGGGMYSPLLVKINLLDPCAAVTANSAGCVTVINYGGATVPPLHHVLNPDANLKTELQEYDKYYDTVVVTGSQSKVRIQGVANQHKLMPFPVNVPGQGSQGDGNSYGTNYMPYQLLQTPTLDGENYIWSVKQRSEGQLVTNNNGLNLHEIRTKIPGIKMKKHNVYGNGTTSKAVIHSQTYTPKYLGIKDWRDNLTKIKFNVDGETAGNHTENAFHYIGVTNRVPSTAALEPARVFMDVLVNYNVRYIGRKNDPASGDPALPRARHQGEL